MSSIVKTQACAAAAACLLPTVHFSNVGVKQLQVFVAHPQ